MKYKYYKKTIDLSNHPISILNQDQKNIYLKIFSLLLFYDNDHMSIIHFYNYNFRFDEKLVEILLTYRTRYEIDLKKEKLKYNSNITFNDLSFNKFLLLIIFDFINIKLIRDTNKAVTNKIDSVFNNKLIESLIKNENISRKTIYKFINSETTNDHYYNLNSSWQKHQSDFKLYLIAPLSSGKSTIINSILGLELLPSKNMACTSKVIEIENAKINNFKANLFYENQVSRKHNINKKELIKWNNDNLIKKIEIKCPIPFMQKFNFRKLKMIDTPGANNSRDENHSLLVDKVLKNKNIDLIMYVINIEHLATNDDQSLLNKIKKYDKNKNLLFILNKTDRLDTEQDESMEDVYNNTNHYLQENNFEDYEIMFYAAYPALLFYKALDEQRFTRKEIIDFQIFYSIFENEEFSLNQYDLIKNKFPEYKREIKSSKKIQVGKNYYDYNSIYQRLQRTNLFKLQNYIKSKLNK